MVASRSQRLRLLAEDADDLAVISGALQDAVASIGDIVFEPTARRLTVGMNRYRWEGGRRERVRCALQIGSVLKVQTRRLRMDAKSAIVELLAVSFQHGEPPGGAVLLHFAGGGDLRVEVECLDAVLADLTDPWPTPRKPVHPD